MTLTPSVINQIENLETDRKHYRHIEQIEASATSITMDIAKEKGRELKKEFIRYLCIARGSICQKLTLLEIFLRLGWISQESLSNLEQDSIEIICMLKGLIIVLSRS